MSSINRQSVMAALIESGLDISKISFFELKEVLQTAKKLPQNLSAEDFEKALKLANDPKGASSIINSLNNHGLEINKKNVQTLESAYEKIPQELDMASIEKIIKDDSALSLDNVYKSKYSANNISTSPQVNWDDFKQEAAKIFDREGIPTTPENIEAAKFLLERDLPLTAENINKVVFLEEVGSKIPQEVFYDQTANSLANDVPPGSIDLYKLAENQLKELSKASYLHQNLNINTEPLRKTVVELQFNKADAAVFIKHAGGEPTENITEALVDTVNKVTSLTPLTANVHSTIYHGGAFTINGVHDSLILAKANAQYEQYATVPNPRYGDSFTKVESQFKPFLDNMGITPTNENLKAAFILSKSNIEINQENLTAIKEIEAKITQTAQTLHPLIAANMLKEGLNPLDMHMDHVLDYINKFNYGKGYDNTGVLAKNILELENAGLDSETKESITAFYRMLHIIRKDGASALGLAYRMGTDLKLGDLMNLAKNFKDFNSGRALDVNIDDSFGELESIIRPESSIQSTIERGISHMDIVIENVTKAASPNSITGLQDVYIEDIIPETVIDTNLVTNEMQTFLSASPEVIHMIQAAGISGTPGNIRAGEKLLSNARALEDSIEELNESEGIKELLPDTSLNDLRGKEKPETILAKIANAVSRLLPDRLASDIKSLLGVSHGLNTTEGKSFRIPIRFGDATAGLKMYVLNEKSLSDGDANILLTLNTKNLGNVSAYFTLNNQEVKCTILTETKSASDILKNQQNRLSKAFESMDVTAEIIINQNEPSSVSMNQSQPVTRDLYNFKV